MDARLIRRVKPRQEFDRAVKLQSRDGHGDWQSVVGAVRTSDSHKISLVRCTLARHVSRALFVCGPLMARQPESNARPVHPVLPALTSQRPPPPLRDRHALHQCRHCSAALPHAWRRAFASCQLGPCRPAAQMTVCIAGHVEAKALLLHPNSLSRGELLPRAATPSCAGGILVLEEIACRQLANGVEW